MNQFTINGKTEPNPVGENESFGTLMAHIQQNFTQEKTLIPSITVNGIAITEEEERELEPISLSEIDSIEIQLAHPRELAEDALQTLKIFAIHLAEQSVQLAIQGQNQAFEKNFQKLIDGLQTMTDTVLTVRQMLRIGYLPTVALLEADLLSILEDLLNAHQVGDFLYRLQLLKEHLPLNLKSWSEEGIPEMIKSRDS